VTFAGTVVDQATGKPFSEFVVHLSRKKKDGAWYESGRTNVKSVDGAFRIEGLAVDGEYGGYVECGSVPAATFGPFTATSLGNSSRIEISKPGSLRVVVKDADGRPRRDAGVALRSMVEFHVPELFMDAYKPDGDVNCTSLAPGEYRLRVSSPDLDPVDQTVNVASNRLVTVDVRL
jgi:hypothetical protein